MRPTREQFDSEIMLSRGRTAEATKLRAAAPIVDKATAEAGRQLAAAAAAAAARRPIWLEFVKMIEAMIAVA